METLRSCKFEIKGKTTFYLEAGPRDGPLMIFVHGWPGIAETWKYQLITFASLGFRVVAPDMPGYGYSTASREIRDYSLEKLVAGLLQLLGHLERDEAIWVGHDWGSGVVWPLAAHHPEVCTGVINICVPYRTIEFGYEHLRPLVNQDIYPRDEYPYGQWEYMKYYEDNLAKAVEQFDANAARALKLFYSRGDPATYGKPSRTARVLHDGGFFSGMRSLPDIPLASTVLDDSLYVKLRESQERNTFFGATAYYVNHDVNIPYSRSAKNDGVLTMPVLFIAAKYDATCSTTNSRLAEPMRKYCRDLTECTVDGAHWVQLEKPAEVNAAIAGWLATDLRKKWPWHQNNPLVKS